MTRRRRSSTSTTVATTSSSTRSARSGSWKRRSSAMVQPVALFHVDASPNSLNAAERARQALAEPALGRRQEQGRGAARARRARHSRSIPATRSACRSARIDWPTWKAFDAPDFSLPERPQSAASEPVDGDAHRLAGVGDADLPPIPAVRNGALTGEFAVSLTEANRDAATAARRRRARPLATLRSPPLARRRLSPRARARRDKTDSRSRGDLRETAAPPRRSRGADGRAGEASAPAHARERARGMCA